VRLAIADLMSANLTTVKADAGSLRRAFQVLARRQFWIEQKVTVAGVHKPDLAEADDTTLILVRLAPLGLEVLRACGIAAVPSEWDRCWPPTAALCRRPTPVWSVRSRITPGCGAGPPQCARRQQGLRSRMCCCAARAQSFSWKSKGKAATPNAG
jgi:hypothetical protein